VLALTSLALVGVEGISEYGDRLLFGLRGDSRPGLQTMHNWRGFFSRISGQGSTILGLTAFASLGSLVLLWYGWRGEWAPTSDRFNLQCALLLTVTLLVSPHVHSQDLVLLIPLGLCLLRFAYSGYWGIAALILVPLTLASRFSAVLKLRFSPAHLLLVGLMVWLSLTLRQLRDVHDGS
jgi:hypothetical protein